MAKRKRSLTREVLLQIPVEDEETTETAREGDGEGTGQPTEDVERVLAQLGEKANTVILMVKNEKTGRLDFIDRIPTEEFSVKDVRDTYGGGSYTTRILDKNGKIITNSGFNIHPRFKGKVDEPENRRTEGGGSSEMTLMRDMMDQQNKLLIAVLTKGGGGETENLLKLAEVLNKGGGGQREGASVKDVLDALDRGIELGKKSVGLKTEDDDEEKDPFGLGPIAGAVATAIMAKSEQERAPQLPAPAPAAALPPPPPKASAIVLPGPTWMVALQPWLKTFERWARENRDVELYCSVFLDQIDEKVYDELMAVAANPQIAFVDNIVGALKMVPSLAAHEDWVRRFAVAVQEVAKQPDDVADPDVKEADAMLGGEGDGGSGSADSD